MRQEREDAKPRQSDEQLEISVRADQGLRLANIAAVRPRADDATADPQPQHADRDHHRRRVDRVPKHVSEHTDPYDLVDQSAEAGTKKQQVEHAAHPAYDNACYGARKEVAASVASIAG